MSYMHEDPVMDAFLFQLGSAVEGVIKKSASQDGCGPNPAFGGWDRYATESTCFRTNAQRFLAYTKVFHGTLLSPGPNTTDILTPLMAAAGLPSVVGAPVDIINMINPAGVDAGPLNGLALTGLSLYCCVNIVDESQSNPTGGAGTVSTYTNAEAMQRAVCCRLLNAMNLTITHKADLTELWVANTRASYFNRGGLLFYSVPPLVFRQQQNMRVRLDRANPDFGGAAFQLFIPQGLRVTIDLGVSSVWLNDPRCGCNWPMHLCGPGEVVSEQGGMGQRGQILPPKTQNNGRGSGRLLPSYG